MLRPITTQEYTIKCSFSFAKEVEEFDPNLVMANFDVKSLFTKIPLTETISLCVENFYRNQAHTDSLSKSYFYKLSELSELFFSFDQNYYEQYDIAAIDSPLRPTSANVFMCNSEKILF